MVRAWERYLNQIGPAPKRPVVAEVALCADRYARGGTEVLTIGVLPVPTPDVTEILIAEAPRTLRRGACVAEDRPFGPGEEIARWR
jgi:hypothetical protein